MADSSVGSSDRPLINETWVAVGSSPTFAGCFSAVGKSCRHFRGDGFLVSPGTVNALLCNQSRQEFTPPYR